MSAYHDIKRKILFDHLDKFPEAGSRTIAKILARDYPQFFRTSEDARIVIRRYRGTAGKHYRATMKQTKYYKNGKTTMATEL